MSETFTRHLHYFLSKRSPEVTQSFIEETFDRNSNVANIDNLSFILTLQYLWQFTKTETNLTF